MEPALRAGCLPTDDTEHTERKNLVWPETDRILTQGSVPDTPVRPNLNFAVG